MQPETEKKKKKGGHERNMKRKIQYPETKEKEQTPIFDNNAQDLKQ